MNEILLTSADVEIQAASQQKRPSVSILAYTGGVMRPPGWPAIVIDLAGADVSGDVPILASHRTEDLDAIAGTGRATIRGGQMFVDGPLTDATPAGKTIIALGRSGMAVQASIGYAPAEIEHVQAGETVQINGRNVKATEGGLRIIRAGKLRECSLLPVGADPGTSVSIQAKGRNMPPATTSTSSPALPASPPNVAAWDQPGLTDLERVRARWNSAEFHDSNIRQQAESNMLAAAAGKMGFADFDRELTRDLLRDRELHIIRAERPRVPIVTAGVARGNLSTPNILQAAFLKHMGQESLAEKALGAEVLQAAADLRTTSVLEIIKAAFTLEHREIPHGQNEMIRAAFSTLSLPGVLGNVANKLMLEAYREFPSVARLIARKLSSRDFKTHTGYRLTGDLVFDQLGPDGEIKHGTLRESSFSFKVDTYARAFSVNRQAIINDDLGALDEVPRMIGRGAALKLEILFWTLVLANTGSFYAEGNGNYIEGADTALALEGLRQAVELMRKQTDAEGAPILVEPKVLVVPPELEATADQLYASTNLVVAVATGAATDTVPDSNPYKGKYRPHVVPHLSNDSYTGNSGKAWYLFGNPADVAAFGIAYLNGQESPTVEAEQADFDTLGMQYRGFLDMGVCQIDHRGSVKSKGET